MSLLKYIWTFKVNNVKKKKKKKSWLFDILFTWISDFVDIQQPPYVLLIHNLITIISP
jgi:hypothetical protein